MQTATLDRQFVFRHFDPDTDIPAVVRLLTAVELVDWDGEETTEADVRAQLAWPDHDPARDRWVVEDPDEPHHVIAYGLVWAKTPQYADLFVATHPSYRRRGIGSALLTRAMDRARDLGVERVGVYANTLNAPASAFLYTHGFQAVSSYWDLLAPPDMPLPEPAWPPGYATRTYDEVQDPVMLADALNRSYADLWGHARATPETIADWLPDVPPRNIVFALAPDGSVAGICRFHTANGGQQAGYIDAPGVVPEHRGAGLYRPLVLTALQQLWSHRRFPVRLESWGDDAGTIAVYRTLGFSSIRHYIAFGMEL